MTAATGTDESCRPGHARRLLADSGLRWRGCAGYFVRAGEATLRFSLISSTSGYGMSHSIDGTYYILKSGHSAMCETMLLCQSEIRETPP